MSLNNGLCKTRRFLIDLNPVEIKYYPFMITLDKFNENYNTLREISGRILSQTKWKM